MVEKQFRLILQATELMQSEDQRSEGNPSEEDSDLECEEEVATQSDGGLAETNAGRQPRALGRKRMYSETIMEQVSPSSPDAKCKQASNLHNERERERRKDLKQAVHRLRNQLQLRKTKKATTISVLKASEQEIKDLLRMEADQKRELGDLQNHHKYLTWKLESLVDEQQRSVSSNPTPVLSPILPTPPPLTSMAPMFYMPPTPSATHSPSSLHQATVPPASPSPFQFGLPLYNRFQPSPLLSPAPSFPMAAHPQPISAPPSRPIFVPPTFTFPPFLPRLPPTGRFTIPTAAGTYSHSHLLSPSFPALMLPSMPLPNPLAVTTPFLPFPTLSADVSSTSSTFTTSSPVSTAPQSSPSSSPPGEGGNLLLCHSGQSHEASESLPIPPSIEAQYQSSMQAEQKSSSEYCSGSECEDENIDGGSDHLIDVESTEQEGGSSQRVCSFLDVQDCQVRQQNNPSKQRTSRTEDISHHQEKQTYSTNVEVVESKNLQSSPTHVKHVGGIRNSEQAAAKVINKDMFTSDIQQHSLYFDGTDMQYTSNNSFHSWKGVSCTKQRVKKIEQIKPSPSIIDLNSVHHPPPVYCS